MNIKKKVVAIGGGHGLGRLLAALSILEDNVTGIVTTTDNGGSTGRIRQCQGGIAWGDMRNCINQLITEPSLGSMLFEYRFKGSGELKDHNLGNLILTALNDMSVRPLEAINLIRDMLKIKPIIVPMSEHPTDLAAITSSKNIIFGETSIDELSELPQNLILQPNVAAPKEAIHAIKHADLIILGPGSFFTSILPPLLIPKISKALASAKGEIMFIPNLSPESGPAGKMTIAEQLSWCQKYMRGRKVDIVLTSPVTEELPTDYLVLQNELASFNPTWRHDRRKLRKIILEYLNYN